MSTILKLIYAFLNFFPDSNARINLQQKFFRLSVAKMLMRSCGGNVNIGRYIRADWSHISIGENSGIGNYAKIEGAIIGSNVLMGESCSIYRRNHAFASKSTPIINQGYIDKPLVEIGDDVWIGDRVMIMAGVKISNGAVIAAGSVVTKDVDSFTVVAGVPAKVISKRI